MSKVWLVTSGTYSDFKLLSIWNDFDLAKKEYERIKIIIGDRYSGINEIIERDLNTSSHNIIWVGISKAGLSSILDELEDWHTQTEISNDILYYKSATDDPVAAIKAANELRAQLIALDRWKEGQCDYLSNKR